VIYCRLGLQANFQRSGGKDCDLYILAIINTGKVPISAIKRLIIPWKMLRIWTGCTVFWFSYGNVGRHVNSYHLVSLNEGGVYSHKFLPPPHPLNCLALNQQFFLKSVRSHLILPFSPRLLSSHSFFPFGRFFSHFRHIDVFFLVIGGGNVGDRGNCFVQFDSLMTWHERTVGALCSERSPPSELWLPLDSCYAVHQECSRCFGTISVITEFCQTPFHCWNKYISFKTLLAAVVNI